MFHEKPPRDPKSLRILALSICAILIAYVAYLSKLPGYSFLVDQIGAALVVCFIHCLTRDDVVLMTAAACRSTVVYTVGRYLG